MTVRFESLVEAATVVATLLAATFFFGVIVTSRLAAPSAFANTPATEISKVETVSRPG